MNRLSITTATFCTLLGLLCLGGSASAEIYKYEDLEGRIYFTDRPMKGRNYRLRWRSGPDAPAASVSVKHYRENRRKFTPAIEATAKKVELQPELLHAVVRAESSYDPKARSKAGAIGLMQLMPQTAQRYGIDDIWNPEKNLDAGARYLRDLLQLFGSDLRLALAAYNAGENAVIQYGRQIPPFEETQRYVEKVIAFLREEMSS